MQCTAAHHPACTDTRACASDRNLTFKQLFRLSNPPNYCNYKRAKRAGLALPAQIWNGAEKFSTYHISRRCRPSYKEAPGFYWRQHYRGCPSLKCPWKQGKTGNRTFLMKSKTVPWTSGVQGRGRRTHSRTYLGFLRFSFATLFQLDPRLSPTHREFSSNIWHCRGQAALTDKNNKHKKLFMPLKPSDAEQSRWKPLWSLSLLILVNETKLTNVVKAEAELWGKAPAVKVPQGQTPMRPHDQRGQRTCGAQWEPLVPSSGMELRLLWWAGAMEVGRGAEPEKKGGAWLRKQSPAPREADKPQREVRQGLNLAERPKQQVPPGLH